MRTEEFIENIAQEAKRNVYRFESIRERVPMGLADTGEFVTAHKEEKPLRYHHLCVTGAGKGDFIRRTAFVLACIYDKSEAAFLILSPYAEYGELLRLRNADVTAPYLRNAADLEEALLALKELVWMRSQGQGFPKLVVVADGLETLQGLSQADVTDVYKRILELLDGCPSEVITGVELNRSMYAPRPGTFVGIGNGLVTIKGGGKADVTYVGSDSSLGIPKEFTYPAQPTISVSLDYFNTLV